MHPQRYPQKMRAQYAGQRTCLDRQSSELWIYRDSREREDFGKYREVRYWLPPRDSFALIINTLKLRKSRRTLSCTPCDCGNPWTKPNRLELSQCRDEWASKRGMSDIVISAFCSQSSRWVRWAVLTNCERHAHCFQEVYRCSVGSDNEWHSASGRNSSRGRGKRARTNVRFLILSSPPEETAHRGWARDRFRA